MSGKRGQGLQTLKPFKVLFLAGFVAIVAALVLWFATHNSVAVVLIVLIGLVLVTVALTGAFVKLQQLQQSKDVGSTNSALAQGSESVIEVLLYLILPW